MSDDNQELKKLLSPHANDNYELNKLLKEDAAIATSIDLNFGIDECSESDKPTPEIEDIRKSVVQWSTSDKRIFVPTSETCSRLVPGVYEIKMSNTVGLYFEKVPVSTKGVLRFPQSNIDRVVGEIQKFWERESLFKEYKLSYKRGILLYGPPGCGKSSAIKMIINDVIERSGIVVKFTVPELFQNGMRFLRQIEKDTPVVTLMEDVDSILDIYNESEVLNTLDGVEHLDKIVYLATTNYPERLGPRIINRPSRFDKRFKIDWPDKQSRKMYLQHIIGPERIKELKIDLNIWVEDTEEMSVAHLKELFIAVVILGDEYEEAVENLKSMKEIAPTSSEDDGKEMGLHTMAKRPHRRIGRR